MTCLKFIQSLGFLKKFLKFAEQFSRPEKSLEIEIKSGKMVKRRKFFFVFKVTTSALEVKVFSFWSNLGLSRPYVRSA